MRLPLVAFCSDGKGDLLRLLVFLLFLLLNASFNGWDGGCSSGPRYLIPAIPFLCFPLMFMDGGYKHVGYPLAALSMINMFVVACVNVMPCEGGGILLSYLYPHFLRGEFGINPNAGAFNLGNLFGLKGFSSLLPLATVCGILVAGIGYLRRDPRSRGADLHTQERK